MYPPTHTYTYTHTLQLIHILFSWYIIQGLFRIAGSAAKVKNLVAAFDARAEQMHLYDPHTIAGDLHMYMLCIMMYTFRSTKAIYAGSS